MVKRNATDVDAEDDDDRDGMMNDWFKVKMVKTEVVVARSGLVAGAGVVLVEAVVLCQHQTTNGEPSVKQVPHSALV